MEQLFEQLQFNEAGLICAIAVDADNQTVLMQAWMNQEALAITLREGNVCYYSRSRKQLWRKGEQSGNQQKLVKICVDCDKDCLLLYVQQIGAACHTGRAHCFYQKIEPETGELSIIAEPIQDPEQLYKKIDL